MADRELRLVERRARGQEGAEALLRQRLRAGHASGQVAELLAALGHGGAARALGVRPGNATTPREWLAPLAGGGRRERETAHALGVRLGLHAACFVYPLWEEAGGWVRWEDWYVDHEVDASDVAPLREALDQVAEWLESAQGELARRAAELGDRALRSVRWTATPPYWVRPRGAGWDVLGACGLAARLPARDPWRPELLAALEAAGRAAQWGWGYDANGAWTMLRDAVLAAAAAELLEL